MQKIGVLARFHSLCCLLIWCDLNNNKDCSETKFYARLIDRLFYSQCVRWNIKQMDLNMNYKRERKRERKIRQMMMFFSMFLLENASWNWRFFNLPIQPTLYKLRTITIEFNEMNKIPWMLLCVCVQSHFHCV